MADQTRHRKAGVECERGLSVKEPGKERATTAWLLRINE
jgi:hypothetical protein